MKYMIIIILALIFTSIKGQTESNQDLRFKKTYYIVYMGSFKTPHLFERKDVPYQLMVIRSKNGNYQYFFGKFSEEVDAIFAQRLLYLNGFTSSKVKKYTKYEGDQENVVKKFN